MIYYIKLKIDFMQNFQRQIIFVSRFGSIIEILQFSFRYTFQFLYTYYTQVHTRKMRKQINFEQKTQNDFLINVKNIFGFVTNYIQDKIKRHQGKWDCKYRKFQAPLSKMPSLAKQLQSIDRSFFIEQIPQAVTQLLSKHSQSSNRVRKQILVDNNIVKRYSYIEENILNNVLKNGKNFNKNQHFDKVLILCPQSKILTWCDHLRQHKVKKLTFDLKQPEVCIRQDIIWQCSYQVLWNKSQMLNKYCFQTIIVDEAQILAMKINEEHQSALYFRKFLSSRHFVFPIITKVWLNKLQWMIPLLQIVLPQLKFSWLTKRYRKQNLCQLNFLLKSCNLARDINRSNKQNKNDSKHFFNKTILIMPECAIQKIRVLNRKFTQIETKKLLENPNLAKNKNQRQYMQSMQELLLHEKMDAIHQSIMYYTQMNIRFAIVIEGSPTYRSIQNFLCERQISYCHYEHHQQVIQFNSNPNLLVCLVKVQYLVKLDFSQNILTNDQITNSALQNYQPDQYLCLSGVKNVLFPDIQWFQDTKRKQQSMRQLFRYLHGDLVRHYFILKGTYEEKWVKAMEQLIGKIQLNIKAKEDIQQLQNQQEGIQQGVDPTFAFSQINLAKVQEQYAHIKVIKGVTDIDQEFDRLQYEALQQRIQRDSKKKLKQQKAKQKNQERLQNQKSQNFQQIKKLINETKSAFLNENLKKVQMLNHKQQKGIDSQEQYQALLRKKQEQTKRKPQQTTRVPIYQAIQQGKVTILQEKVKPLKKTQIIQNKDKDITNKSAKLLQKPDQLQNKQYDQFKQDETQQVQIIQVRKPAPKPKLPKQKAKMFKFILYPNVPIKLNRQAGKKS